MTASEAETLLDLQYVGFASVNDTDISYSDSLDFVDVLENSVMLGLCTGRTIGVEQTVDSDIAYLRVTRHDFIDISTEDLDMSCDSSCSGTIIDDSSTVSSCGITLKNFCYEISNFH